MAYCRCNAFLPLNRSEIKFNSKKKEIVNYKKEERICSIICYSNSRMKALNERNAQCYSIRINMQMLWYFHNLKEFLIEFTKCSTYFFSLSFFFQTIIFVSILTIRSIHTFIHKNISIWKCL